VVETLHGQSFTTCLGVIKARTVLYGIVCFLYMEKDSGEILSVALIREIPIAEQEPN